MSELHEKAVAASRVITPSELHGLVCGFAAGNPGAFSLPEFIHLAGADALTNEAAITEFVTASLDDFTSQDMDFSPLVADDEEHLSQRLTDLSEWCAGFLSGFGATAVQSKDSAKQLPPDVQEIVRDFASISGLSGDVEEDDQDESSFMELFEYARVAAVLVLTMMSEQQTSD